jgi:aspartyl-tRNA(Asn)/glutamyl-tRNA(Gln) amidotransferase subunit C
VAGALGNLRNLQQEFNRISRLSGQLKEVDVTGMAPMQGSATVTMMMCPDVVTARDDVEEILSNAPERIGDFFVVPKTPISPGSARMIKY